MKKFEYMTAVEVDSASLNQAGRDGWELVQVVTQTTGIIAIYKREWTGVGVELGPLGHIGV